MFKNIFLNETIQIEPQKDELSFEVKTVELFNAENSKQKKAKIVVVKAGWNLNDIYIEEPVLDELVNEVMKKPKLFTDHDMFAWLGRSNRDWVATFESVEKVKDEVHGVIVFTENPNTIWLYDELKKSPEMVQFSIHVKGILTEYKDEAQNRNGYKMSKLQSYKSTDVVSYAAAGGKGLEILNSILENKIDQFNKLVSNKNMELEMITNAKELRTAHPQFVAEIVNEEIAPVNVKVVELSGEVETLKQVSTTKDATITELNSKITELTNSVNTLTSEKDALKLEVDTYKVKETKSAWENSINTEIVNAKLDEKLITPVFKESLLKAQNIDEVKKLIEDRKEVFNSTQNVIINGVKPAKKEGEAPVEEDLDVLAARIKN